MSNFKSLDSPVDDRRKKLIERLEEQKALARDPGKIGENFQFAEKNAFGRIWRTRQDSNL